MQYLLKICCYTALLLPNVSNQQASDTLPVSTVRPAITALAVLDSQRVVVASRAGLRIIDANTFETVEPLPETEALIHKLIVRHNKIIAVGGQPAESGWGAMLWRRAEQDNATAGYLMNHLAWCESFDDCIYDAALSPDESSDGKRLLLTGLDGQAVIRTLSLERPGENASEQPNAEPAIKLTGHSSGVTGAVWLDENSVATSSRDGSIRIWNAETGQLLRTLSQHTSEVLLLQRSPDSEISPKANPLVASAGLDQTIRFWQPKIGRMLRFCKLENETATSMTWSSDGKVLLVGTTAGKIHWIDPTSATIGRQIQASSDWITAIVMLDTDTALYGTAHGTLDRLKVNR